MAFLHLGLLIAIGPVLGLFGKFHWFLDLFNHLQAQYFVALIMISVCLLLWKKPLLAGISSVLILIPAVRLAPLYFPSADHDGRPIRVATFNVLGSNERYQDTVAWIREADPDLIYLPECDSKWAEGLEPLSKIYPYGQDLPLSGNIGYCFLSKYPIHSNTVHRLGKLRLPLLECVVRTPMGDVTVFGAHPLPPVNEFWASERDLYLGELTRLSTTSEGHALILGDLNATRWSCQLETILNHFGDTSKGHGYRATWMRENWLVTIPIDHIFTRGFTATNARRTGPYLGSDHRPVVADLVW